MSERRVPIPADLLARCVELLAKLEQQTPTVHDKPVIIRPLTRAFAMVGVGKTRGHQLINEGVFEVVSIGKRGKGITLRSIESLPRYKPPRRQSNSGGE